MTPPAPIPPAPIPPADQAERVAAEHVVWAATQGLRPADILASIGAPPPLWRAADWHDAAAALADLWRRLTAEERAGAASEAAPPPFPGPAAHPDWRLAA